MSNKYENNKSNSRQNNYHPSNQVENNNVRNESYEFNSYNSYSVNSCDIFGIDIFKLYSAEQILSIVKDPMSDGNNELLRELSLILYGLNGVYTNTVDYMKAMPTLDRVIIAHGNSSQKKRRNKSLMSSTLKKIKDNEIIRDALFKGMIEGIAFYYFETTQNNNSQKKTMTDYEVRSITEVNSSDNIKTNIELNDLGINASIISLPAKYTQIVGIKNSSYVIAFNLDYFMNGTEDWKTKLKKYPKEIRDAYIKKKNSNSLKDSGNWIILDNNKTIVHKIRSKREEKYGRPLVLAAINDILYSDDFKNTKRNILGEINNQIIYQTFPEGKDKGSSALTKQQQQKQHEAVKGAVLHKNNRGGTSFFSVAAGTKINKVETFNTDIFDSKYEANLNDDIALDMGIASSLLNGSSSGSYSSQENNLELIASLIFEWVAQISAELNKCISNCIIKDQNNWVEVYYLPITNVNKKAMVENAKALYLQGKGSLSFWISACGISPEAYIAMLDQEKEEDWENKYPVHQISYTQSAKSAGRPTTDDPKDSTIASRSSGGNNTPSPSDK